MIRHHQATVTAVCPAALLSVFAPTALAQAERSSVTAGLLDGPYLLQVFGSLLLVCGCIAGLVFLLKRLNGLQLANGNPIRVLGSVKVGSREKVLLLSAGGKQLLVGVAAGSVRTLHLLDEPLPEEAPSRSGNPDFASMLRSSVAGGE